MSKDDDANWQIVPDFLSGGGDMGALMRAHDWSVTSIGPSSTWPQSLRSTLSICLNSATPSAIYWGPEALLLYNDAYSEILVDRHPGALGRPFEDVWPEAWSTLGPQLASVRSTGKGFAADRFPLLLERHGELQQTHWFYSFAPIRGEQGVILGVYVIGLEITASVQAEQRRAAENERLNRIFKQAPGFRAMLEGPKHRIVLTNPAYLQLVGHREVVGKTVAEILPDAVEQGYLGLLDQVFASNEAFALSGAKYAVHAAPDGPVQERYVDFVHQPVSDAEGRVTAILVDGYDITDRVLAEEELRKLNDTLDGQVAERTAELRRYQNIVEAMVAPICAFDSNYRLIAFNRAHNDEFRRVNGFDTKVGDVFPDLFLPEQGAIMRSYMTRALAGESFTVVEEFGRPELDVPVWEITYTPLRDEGGRIIGAFHHAIDITARLRAQAALRKTTMRAETYFSFSNDYLFLIEVDAEGVARFADINPACERAMGLVRSNILGRAVDEFLPHDSAADINLHARLCLETREPQTYLAIREYTKGNKFVIEGRVTFVEGGANGGGLLLFSGSDVTERRQVEDQLRQAQKMEAVGQLTGGLAHDFNNLLTGIMGNLELLQTRIARGRLDDIERFINAAQGAGQRAASLTQRLLAFSRRQTLDPRPVGVNRLITGMEDLLRRTVGGTTEIEIVGAGGLWTANIDAAQLENALLNLCINARDAMPDGGRITIETANKWIDERVARERDMTPGQYLSICVTDTGTGMSADTIARAFEPFYTTKPIGQGTGLGLSMIYGFAHQSGGQVCIYSEVGQGTTVCIYLPRHHGDAENADIAEAPRAVEGAKGQTILLIDDEATIRHLLDEVLAEAGYTVINAADGAAGIKVLQSRAQIELLITDVGLPNGMNGRQVADAARMLRPGLKVLFITGYAENAAVGNGHLEPGMALLTKPFSLDALAGKVGDMMKSTGTM